jgi:hypothetical protein
MGDQYGNQGCNQAKGGKQNHDILACVRTASFDKAHVVDQNEGAGWYALNEKRIDGDMNQTPRQLEKRRRFVDG